MKILVAVKRVVDYNVKIRVAPDGSGVDLNNVKMSMNPFCEIAVEEAIRIKESGNASEIIVASIGSKQCQETIRQALAMGADRGVLLETAEEIQPLSAAKLLAKLARDEQADLIILGKQAIDDDSNQTGQMLAELLDYPQGTFASDISIKDQHIVVTREVDGGLQTLELLLPAVITTDLRLNEPRFVKLPNIMKAKKKPLNIIDADSLGIDIKPRLEIVNVSNPSQRSAGIKVKSVAELIDKLKNEAKVI